MELPWSRLKTEDDAVYRLIQKELIRQQDGLELIASENFASEAVMLAMGNVFTNKYAEGTPGKRYYGGCEVVDELENLAIERLTSLFAGARFANVQPHSGAQANASVYLALLQPGDSILGLDLSHGGHLTHGSAVNFSGLIYKPHFYHLDPKTELIDYDEALKQAQAIKPKLIVAGASSYPRQIDFKRFREIADSVGAYLMVDMAHIAGLVAAGLHPSPFPHAHVVTSTTHKTLRGPRGGFILWMDEALTPKLNKGVFPGTQGGPLEHIIAAKAVCFKEAALPSFKSYQEQVLKNAKALSVGLTEHGFKLVSGGTDNHLMLINLGETGISGKELEESLGKAHITVNKNSVPYDKRSPFVTSGLRVGTPAVTTRGMGESEMKQIAEFIAKTYENTKDEKKLKQIAEEVIDLCSKFKLYPKWSV